jgi:raffinose/stachyose/melibiose transport system substrate-binding protein
MKEVEMKKIIFLALALAIPSLVAAGPVNLVVPHYKAGQNVGAKFFLPQIERFNKKYAGVYSITIQELPQDSYNDKIKQLAQQNKLPALVEGGDKQWFEQVMIANNKVFDFGPWLNGHPAVKSLCIDDALEFNTQGGKVVSLPQAVTRPIGLFYNSTLFKPTKGIGAMTMDEFAAALGSNKIAFMTGENAWTSGLLLSAIIANEKGAAAMLKAGVKDRIYDFNGPIWVSAVAKLQKFLQKYASSNTLGAAYADAANAFMSKNAAVIPNGPWMINDFGSGSENKWSGGFAGDQVKADIYPGNVALDNVMAYRWWIPATATPDEQKAALAFLEFMSSPAELEAYMLAEGGTAPKLKPSKEFLAKQAGDRLNNELLTAVNAKTVICVPFYETLGNSVDKEFAKLLPKLIDGSLAPAQFCAEFSKKAVETKLQ